VRPICILVGGIPTPLKNISQLGLLFPIYGKIKNVQNHQPVYIIYTVIIIYIFCVTPSHPILAVTTPRIGTKNEENKYSITESMGMSYYNRMNHRQVVIVP